MLQATIAAHIVDVAYARFPMGDVTVCSVTLDNGYSMRGEAICTDLELGQRRAYADALYRLQPMFRFLACTGGG